MRRAATFLAALGALVMSSGIALMVTATPANAAPGDKVVVCKYVSTPGGVLDHVVVVAEDTLPDAFNGTFPFEWTDAQGQTEKGSIAIRFADPGPPPEQAQDIDPSECVQSAPVVATASVTPIQPTCDNGNVADYTTSGDNVEFSESAAPAPGTSITVTATATGDAEFEGGATSKDFVLDFDAAADCTVVSPPTTPNTTVKPPKKHPTETVTPTVVHAGLAGVSSEDMRSEQGLALMFAGMLMLVAAGGLGLRVRGSESRI